MYNRLKELMVNLQPRKATDIDANVVLDEEDERERVLLVDCGSKRYAMNVTLVREVVRARGVTRVPGTPEVVRGLVNVRGMVVTVLSLEACLRSQTRKLGFGETQSAVSVTEPRAEFTGSIVLLEHGGGGGGRLVGLAVDAVRDVRTLDAIAAVQTGSVGVASAGDEVVELLDVAALIARHLISSSET